MAGQMLDCVIRGGTAVLADRAQEIDIGVSEGVIVELAPSIMQRAAQEIDARSLHIFPGAVDVHVHFNDPGRADWEGGATGSAACAAGGTTTFCEMPLNATPPTLCRDSFAAKLSVLSKSSHVDFGLWGGLTPRNVNRLTELAECGVMGFKAFMCDSGIDDFLMADEDTLGKGMEQAAQLGLPVAVHAEDQALTAKLTDSARRGGAKGVRDYLASRPIQAETLAIERAIALAQQTQCSLHIVHVSSAEGVTLVSEAQQRGVNVTCETCPHYLVLTDDDVARLGAVAKCSPPIRNAADQAALWRKLIAGEILLVASDHSPAPDSMKQSDDFFAIWGGIAGCQSLLGIMLAAFCRERAGSVSALSKLVASAPARRFGLMGKGEIALGQDADLALVDLSQTPRLSANDLQYRHRVSPYVGMIHGGQIRRTILRGETIWENGKLVGVPRGKFVSGSPARSRSGVSA